MDWKFIGTLAIIEAIMFSILMAVGLAIWLTASLIMGVWL